MDAYKIVVKLFVENDTFGHAEFVPIFHRWIQTQAVENHLLIDVADYGHVPDGPGTVLISSEANFHADRGNGRLGLMYSRKQSFPGGFAERLRCSAAEALKAAARLEQEPELAGRLKFKTDEILIRLNDRLRAPNNDQTFAEVKPALEALGRELYGKSTVTIDYKPSPLGVFEVRLRSAAGTSVSALLESISSLSAGKI